MLLPRLERKKENNIRLFYFYFFSPPTFLKTEEAREWFFASRFIWNSLINDPTNDREAKTLSRIQRPTVSTHLNVKE